MLLPRRLFPHWKKAMVFLRLLERSGATCVSTLIFPCLLRSLGRNKNCAFLQAVGMSVFSKERRGVPLPGRRLSTRLLGFSMYFQWPSQTASCAGRRLVLGKGMALSLHQLCLPLEKGPGFDTPGSHSERPIFFPCDRMQSAVELRGWRMSSPWQAGTFPSKITCCLSDIFQ